MTKSISIFLYFALLIIPATAVAGTQNFHTLTVPYKTYASATSAWRVNENQHTETVSITAPELKIFNDHGQAVLAETGTTRIANSLKDLPSNLRALIPVPGELSLEKELSIARDASGTTFNPGLLMNPAYTVVLYVLPSGMCAPCSEISSLIRGQAALQKNAHLNFVEIGISM